MSGMRQKGLGAGEVARRLLWAILAGLGLGAFALQVAPAPLGLKVGLSVALALLLPLPGVFFAREDTPGAANAPGTLLSLLGLGALVGLFVALETLVSGPLASHLALVASFLLALVPGYLLGAHGRRLRQTWPMGLAVGLATWVGFALLIVLLAALLALRASVPLVPSLTLMLHGQALAFALGLPGAALGGIVGACLRVLPVARAACPDEVKAMATPPSRTSASR